MRGISPTAQDAWLKGKPRPVQASKYVPYKSISLTAKPIKPFSRNLIGIIGGGLAGRPERRGIRPDHLKTWTPPKQIIQEAAQKHGITVSELIGESRCKHYVIARQEAAYRIRKECGYGLPRIGKLLGGRDHTTILHACRAHEKRMAASA